MYKTYTIIHINYIIRKISRRTNAVLQCAAYVQNIYIYSNPNYGNYAIFHINLKIHFQFFIFILELTPKLDSEGNLFFMLNIFLYMYF